MNKLLGATETREMSVFDVKALLIMKIATTWKLQSVEFYRLWIILSLLLTGMQKATLYQVRVIIVTPTLSLMLSWANDSPLLSMLSPFNLKWILCVLPREYIPPQICYCIVIEHIKLPSTEFACYLFRMAGTFWCLDSNSFWNNIQIFPQLLNSCHFSQLTLANGLEMFFQLNSHWSGVHMGNNWEPYWALL